MRETGDFRNAQSTSKTTRPGRVIYGTKRYVRVQVETSNAREQLATVAGSNYPRKPGWMIGSSLGRSSWTTAGRGVLLPAEWFSSLQLNAR